METPLEHRRYKLIKTYPNSPELGTEFRPHERSNEHIPVLGRYSDRIPTNMLLDFVGEYFEVLPLHYRILDRDENGNITAIRRLNDKVLLLWYWSSN